MTDNEYSDMHTEVVELYKEGYSCKDICSQFQLSVSNVRKTLKEAGFNTRNYRKASDSVKDKVLLLIKNGYSYNQIEQLLHVSTHLVREIVLHNGFTGFAPKFHHPIQLEINKIEVSEDVLLNLRELYLFGKFGLVECADLTNASDQDFLWFVFHLREKDHICHRNNIKKNVQDMYLNGVPVTAIAKNMHISPSIVKKLVKALD